VTSADSAPEYQGGTVPQLEPGRCHGCCRWVPTRRATYRQTIGALILRFPSGVQGEFCAPCRQRYFWTFTGVTLVLGWWGIISFFSTLFVIPANLVWHLRPTRDGGGAPGSVPTGACHWCGRTDLRRADQPASLIIAAALGALVAFYALTATGRALLDGDPIGLVILLIALAGAVPIAALVLRMRRPFDRCPGCGNEQPAG
jgi:hypothetical protein